MNLGRLAALGLLLSAAPAARAADLGPKLALPIACKIGETCEIQNYVDRDPGPGASDYRCGHRTYEGHGGVDIRILDMAAQRRGVDVLAAAPGRVARLRDGVADISIRAANAPSVEDHKCGNGVVIDHGGGWETQYCHLARGSVKVKVGDQVVAGQPLAHVGLSGMTEFPHLHLSVRHGTIGVDPFAPTPGAGCAAQPSMWTPAAAKATSYKAGAILNAGFADHALTADELEAGGLPRPGQTAPWLVAYGRAIGLQKGDVMELTLTAPDGAVLAADKRPPLAADRAVEFRLVGKRRPGQAWPAGTYRAVYRVLRDGSVAMTRNFAITF